MAVYSEGVVGLIQINLFKKGHLQSKEYWNEIMKMFSDVREILVQNRLINTYSSVRENYTYLEIVTLLHSPGLGFPVTAYSYGG